VEQAVPSYARFSHSRIIDSTALLLRKSTVDTSTAPGSHQVQTGAHKADSSHCSTRTHTTPIIKGILCCPSGYGPGANSVVQLTSEPPAAPQLETLNRNSTEIQPKVSKYKLIRDLTKAPETPTLTSPTSRIGKSVSGSSGSRCQETTPRQDLPEWILCNKC